MKYEFSKEAIKILEDISDKIPPEELLSEAISLLSIVFEAKSTGKRIYITDENYVPITQLDLNISPTVVKLEDWRK